MTASNGLFQTPLQAYGKSAGFEVQNAVPALEFDADVLATRVTVDPRQSTSLMLQVVCGSMGRMLLHVIASGTGKLPANKMPLPTTVLNAEFQCDELLQFQSNTDLADAHAQLAEALEVTPQVSHDEPACLRMQGVMSDGLANNLHARAVGRRFAPASTVIEYPTKLSDSSMAAIALV